MVVNYLAVLAAGVAGWLVGAVWYGVLGRQWMAAQGMSEERIQQARAVRQMPITPMIIAFVAQLIMALMLSGIMGHLGGANVTVGIISGVLIWFGFIVTTIVVGNAFQHRKFALTLIDSGHWLGVLIVQGIVLGLMG